MPEPETPPQNYYQRLGVKPTASAQQIRRAFRDLSKLYHPDTTDLPEAEATVKFQELNEAYATLTSPEKRWAYDQQMGYSRISVIRPPADLNVPAAIKRREYKSNAYLDPTDRPLSAGEIFALFILGVTFVACLVLVVTISLTQGEPALANETLAPPPPNLESSGAPTSDQEISSTAVRFHTQRTPAGHLTSPSRTAPPLSEAPLPAHAPTLPSSRTPTATFQKSPSTSSKTLNIRLEPLKWL